MTSQTTTPRPAAAECVRCDAPAGPAAPEGARRVALVGNPNTGKTTLFNRLCGLNHKTGNFPGTTLEARTGVLHAASGAVELIDLPGIYSLELEQTEAEICRQVLAGTLMPSGERTGDPDAVCVVLDATNLARNLLLAGEVLRRRLPTLVVVNMIDLARKQGLFVCPRTLEEQLGCSVELVSARSGERVDAVATSILAARVPNRTPPGTREALEAWADRIFEQAVRRTTPTPAATPGAVPATLTISAAGTTPAPSADRPPLWSRTDRIDRAVLHPIIGTVIFLVLMTGFFWSIFAVAKLPMDLIDHVFGWLSERVLAIMPPGPLAELLSKGVIGGVSGTLIFLPQICLLFFLISLLEDTGYLSRAALLMDRLLRPFGLPGHAFIPLLSSHACALPGIMACRAIPDRTERLAAILVAPFMTCSARLPVYVLLTTLLFRDSPLKQAIAFVGCYALGAVAGLLTSLLARRTILRGRGRPMALELPTYKMPSIRTALVTTYDRGLTFITSAGKNILAICVVLWWLSAYPHSAPPPEAVAMREQVQQIAPGPDADGTREALEAEAAALEARHAASQSYAASLGRFVQPVFEPLGFDWRLSVGVVTSFAAREVFVSTMSIVTTGHENAEDDGVMRQVQDARRDDGVTPVFTAATSWALLVYYVLAMQCLPTLAVTAREAGGMKWALLQLAWMCGLAYALALVTHQALLAMGVA